MATSMIVPHISEGDHEVHFKDGAVILPDWQAVLLPADVKYVDCTYQEWVALVPNRHLVRNATNKALGDLLTQHMQRL